MCLLFAQSLDLARETVNLAKTGSVEVSDLAAQVPTDAARYHLFWYRHTHEGDFTESAGGCTVHFSSCVNVIYSHVCCCVCFFSSFFFLFLWGYFVRDTFFVCNWHSREVISNSEKTATKEVL